MKRKLLSPFFLILMISSLYAEKAVKIMPVGNSITAGEHYNFPTLEERTGYRKDLYWMLINSGYNVDFVGSQTHGIRPETDSNWYDWNNEAYPGSQINGIARKTKEALDVYKPDILLVHVGTNGGSWERKPGQVMAMLDSINAYSVDYDHPMTVFLCKIVKFFIEENSAPISQFNINVADSVAARTGDKIKIIMVDMENGAGLDYTDNPPDSTAVPPYEGGDYWGRTYPNLSYDKYHPNDKGNTKMAVKFYEELVKELGEPTKVENLRINQQPQQIELYQNYPNPFNPSTYVKFNLPEQTNITLSIYDMNGCLIETLTNSSENAGTHVSQWNASQIASGVYLYTLKAGKFSYTKKCLLYK
ncbi:T9SS type A sorting domain-containing protein [bacterium]